MAGLASEFLEFYGALRRTTSMNTKAKAPPLGGEAQAGSWLTPPWTLEERLRRIETMAQRINGYIGFMSQVGSLNGTSTEAKENAVTAFYEQMVLMECQLGRIQEDFRSNDRLEGPPMCLSGPSVL
jgi:hypothetical protein